MAFLQKLLDASRHNNSLLCVGLDPDPQRLPGRDVFAFNREIIDATADLVCAYKPNLAFYEALGREGLRALERTVAHIPRHLLSIGDAKRGDIGHSAEAYARALFDVFGFDAVTVNPYLGFDSVEPFLKRAEKGAFILCKTSNSGAADFQEILCQPPDGGPPSPLYEVVGARARQWDRLGNLGLVVGATYPEQLRRVRELCPDLPLLIPGIGAQGGDLSLAVGYGVDRRGERAVINVSRQVLYASTGRDFAEAARREALALREEINRHRGSGGVAEE